MLLLILQNYFTCCVQINWEFIVICNKDLKNIVNIGIYVYCKLGILEDTLMSVF